MLVLATVFLLLFPTMLYRRDCKNGFAILVCGSVRCVGGVGASGVGYFSSFLSLVVLKSNRTDHHFLVRLGRQCSQL